MGRAASFLAAAVATVALAAAGAAQAQSRAVCQNTAPNAYWSMGHPGHNLLANTYACTVTSGPHAGSIMHGGTYLEVRGGEGWLLSANGSLRSGGGVAVFQHLEGSFKSVMKDGKPAGWTMNGQSRYQGASGPLQALNGRTMVWQAAATGAETFTLEWTDR
jgi:hypothetical protein